MGWKTQDMVAGLPGILNLAAAGGTDLALTADIVTDGLTGMGMSAKDTDKFVDIMAATITGANTDVALMGETLKYVGPVAGTLGVSMEDLSLAIGLMGNSGIKGSQAGTALRAGLTNLIKPSKQAYMAMEKYGIEIVKTEDGQVDLLKTMAMLSDKLGGLDETTQAAAISAIFGKEAMSGWAAIINSSGDDFTILAESIYNASGKAEEMSSIMQDNLNGQIANLKSALEEAAISIGQVLLPMFKNLTSFIQKGVTWFNSLDDSQKKQIVTIAGIAAAIGPLLIIFGSLLGAIGNIATGVDTLKLFWLALKKTALIPIKTFITGTLIPALSSLWAFLLANPITLVIAAIAALVAAFIYCWKNVDGFKEFFINAWEKIKEFTSKAIEAVKEKLSEWWQALSEFFTVKIPQFVEGVAKWFSEVPGKIKKAFDEAVKKVTEWGTSVWNYFTTEIPKWIDGIRDWFAKLPERIGFALGAVIGTIARWGVDAWNWVTTEVPKLIERIVTFYMELPGKIWNVLVQAYNKVVEWGTNTYNIAKEKVKSTIDSVVQFFSELPGKVWNWLVNTYTKVVQWGQQVYTEARNKVQQTINSVVQFFSELPGKVWTWLTNTVQKVTQWGTNMVTKARQAATDTLNAIVNKIKEIPGQMINQGKEIVRGIWSGITSMVGWIGNQVKGFASGVVSGFKSAFGIKSPSRVMRDVIGKPIVQGIEAGIDSEADSLLKTAEMLKNDLADTITPDFDMIVSDFATPDPYEFNKESKINNIHLNIEKFENNTDKDIEEIAEELAYYIKEKSR